MSKNNKQSKAVEVEVEQPAEAVAMPVAAPAPVRNSGLIQTGVAQYKVKTVLNVRIVSPKDLPEGAFFVAQVMSFSDSPVTTYKSRLIKFSTTDQGGDLLLPQNGRKIVAAENAYLAECVGQTIITADGTTLLGADDKAGIALFDVAEVEAPTA